MFLRALRHFLWASPSTASCILLSFFLFNTVLSILKYLGHILLAVECLVYALGMCTWIVKAHCFLVHLQVRRFRPKAGKSPWTATEGCDSSVIRRAQSSFSDTNPVLLTPNSNCYVVPLWTEVASINSNVLKGAEFKPWSLLSISCVFFVESHISHLWIGDNEAYLGQFQIVHEMFSFKIWNKVSTQRTDIVTVKGVGCTHHPAVLG